MDISEQWKAIPQERLLIYLIALGLIPFIALGFYAMEQQGEVEQTKLAISRLQLLSEQKERKQSANRITIARFKDADHFYIDKRLESLRFLEPEIQNLEEISNNPNFTEDESVRNRLDFLTGAQNRLHFTEGALQSTPLFQEVVETATHPVQIDAFDLKKILQIVEGIAIQPVESTEGRPQLLVLDFKLDKKRLGFDNQVFVLNMKLLKREFL